MAIFGVSCGFNDASLAVVSGEQILYASHAERHSKVKFDKHLHPELVSEALRYGEPNTIVYYEKPWSKLTRQLYAGQKLQRITHYLKLVSSSQSTTEFSQ